MLFAVLSKFSLAGRRQWKVKPTLPAYVTTGPFTAIVMSGKKLGHIDTVLAAHIHQHP